jgi:hypothetical protein
MKKNYNFLKLLIYMCYLQRDSMMELAVELYQHCYWEENDVRYCAFQLVFTPKFSYSFCCQNFCENYF